MAEEATAATAGYGRAPVYTPVGKANEERDESKFVRVPVTTDDRVETVAARFGLSAAELRRHNRTLIFEFCTADHVWVPLDSAAEASDRPRDPAEDGANRLAIARRAFLLRAPGATPEEANYYLDEAGAGGLERALQQWKEDVAWEEGGTAAKPAQVAPLPGLPPAHAPSAPPAEL